MSSGGSSSLSLSRSDSNKCALARLLEKQEEEIELLTQRIEVWSKYKNDYLELKKQIINMKDKIRHPHRVPIAGTQLAFVQANIIHTNELTVLLGDNYFALRTAKQAAEIIDRRLDNVNDMLKKSKEAKQKAEEWLKAASDHKRDKEEFVEIIETM